MLDSVNFASSKAAQQCAAVITVLVHAGIQVKA
jgi:hypothetical protein